MSEVDPKKSYRILTIIWIVTFLPSAYAVGRLLYLMTIESMDHGPALNIPFWIMHSAPLVGLGMLLLIPCACAGLVALFYLIRGRVRKAKAPVRLWVIAIATALIVSVSLIHPYTWFRWTLDTIGPGEGAPALMARAAKDGDTEVLQILFDHGTDPNNEEHPLRQAAEYGVLETMQMLVDNGADVNHTAKYGGTALMKAASLGNVYAMKFLLDNGADINAADNSGHTALMDAAYSGQEDAVQLLLEYGADVSLRTELGKSARDFAEGKGFETIVNMLVEAESSEADE